MCNARDRLDSKLVRSMTKLSNQRLESTTRTRAVTEAPAGGGEAARLHQWQIERDRERRRNQNHGGERRYERERERRGWLGPAAARGGGGVMGLFGGEGASEPGRDCGPETRLVTPGTPGHRPAPSQPFSLRKFAGGANGRADLHSHLKFWCVLERSVPHRAGRTISKHV